MIFNSHEFIFVFLPLALLGYYLVGAIVSHTAAIVFLTASSLYFYGWWNPVYLLLLLCSALFNYGLGLELGSEERERAVRRKTWLVLGMIFNLSLLGFYKYANFVVINLNTLFSTSLVMDQVTLPLAISFFTFQQIAYLADVYQERNPEHNFVRYTLFITFFPHLIAGPLVHHREMLPQFAQRQKARFSSPHFAVGLSLFCLGLAKKVLLADNLAPYAGQVFQAAEEGMRLSLITSWSGALAYTFQLYFDFSGYSDMAVGLARMFNIRLPANFNSPYKAESIIDFWRRWHMTLSRFLLQYLYIPLGGSRLGEGRHMVNLMITMLLGGLWHGANWMFVAWGGLHGLCLMINHAWRRLGGERSATWGSWYAHLSRAATFTVVVMGWVFFRATTFDGALAILQGMLGLNGLVVAPAWEALLGPLASLFQALGGRFGPPPDFQSTGMVLFCLALVPAVWLLPNTQEIMYRYRPSFVPRHQLHARLPALWQPMGWRPTMPWGVGLAILFVIIALQLHKTTEFLYYQF